jgi:hypothetical protein
LEVIIMSATAGQPFNFSRAEVLTKYVYADAVEDLVPESDITAKEMPFVKAKQLGRKFLQPVTLSRSMGATFNSDGGAFTLNQGLAPLELQAEILGCELVLREYMSYGLMNRALQGDKGKGPASKAFIQATSQTMSNLVKGSSYFRELHLLYGGGSGADANLGVIASTTSSTGTTLVVVVTAATWATAIWAGAENGEFDIYNGSTLINTNGVDSARTNKFVLSSMDEDTRTLTFTSHADNVTAAASAAGYVIYFSGSRTTQGVGIEAAFATSGSLWNIAKTYHLWSPKSVAVGGQLTFEKLMRGSAKVANTGFRGTLNVHVNPKTWQDLADDQAALVRRDSKSTGKAEMGFDDLVYHSQTGKLVIKSNIYVKQGTAFGLPDGHCMRVGSTDITFEQPGYGKMIREMENTAAVEVRNYYDQAFFCDSPGHMIRWTGIVNSADAT